MLRDSRGIAGVLLHGNKIGVPRWPSHMHILIIRMSIIGTATD
jgi:hypothetical protein